MAAKKTTAARKATRTRVARVYPAGSFEESLPIGQAIHMYASGERVRRETLLKQINKSPDSSATRQLITNSSKYGLTTGSYGADFLELTDDGRIACSPDVDANERRKAQFKLAIDGVPPFKHLYSTYVGKKLPTREVMKDSIQEAKLGVDDTSECVDTFVVNAKFLGLLAMVAGAETLVSIDAALALPGAEAASVGVVTPAKKNVDHVVSSGGTDWSKTCFYVTPIGGDGSEPRKHADLFLNSLIEPALKEFDLQVVRADKIGEAGMITSQILEHLLRSRLVIVDMSFHNPNVFYEMAVRHASKLPVVQICRKADNLPFDVNQVRTVVIDATDIFTLVPRLQTYQAEIATQARAVLGDEAEASNPLTVFFPGFSVTIPDPTR